MTGSIRHCSRSLNEIDQIGRKAARGSGLPWGVADDVGRALYWLHAFGLDGVTMLAELFARQDHSRFKPLAPGRLDRVWHSTSGELSPILTGLAISDAWALQAGHAITIANIAGPLLVVGFVRQHLAAETGMRLRWGEAELVLGGGRLAVDGPPEALYQAQTEKMTISSTRASARGRTPVIGDTTVAQSAWRALEELAQRTYVAATAENRLRGAGAGLQDND